MLRAPARAGDGTYTGVCSGYLAQLRTNGTVFTFVREPSIAFRPPDNPHVPMIMIGAGTGMAPFRGFLQERAALRDQGVPVAASLLFFGCRNQETDLLYAEEMPTFEQRGLVRVENAFSRGPGRRLPLRPGTRCSTAPTRSGACCSRRRPSSSAATPPPSHPGSAPR